MLESLLLSLENLYGTNNISVLLSTLETTDLQTLYIIFIEAKFNFLMIYSKFIKVLKIKSSNLINNWGNLFFLLT